MVEKEFLVEVTRGGGTLGRYFIPMERIVKVTKFLDEMRTNPVGQYLEYRHEEPKENKQERSRVPRVRYIHPSRIMKKKGIGE